jgi:hypothetical protein
MLLKSIEFSYIKVGLDKLPLIQVGVEILLFQNFRVGTALNDAAVLSRLSLFHICKKNLLQEKILYTKIVLFGTHLTPDPAKTSMR